MAQGFDRVAKIYRLMERLAFGRQLERARFAHVAALQSCANILILGDGDGRCLEVVLRIAPNARITSVDASPAMLSLARRRATAAGGADRVTFVCADIREQVWTAHHYDAVLTMFVLDCFNGSDVAGIVAGLANALAPGGRWLFADFAVPDEGWRRLHARVLVSALYGFFRWQTGIDAAELPPSEALIESHGLRIGAAQTLRAGSIRSVLFIA